MFGAINALFSGLAFGGIVYTILLQREELSAQRQELELTRQELKLTRVEFEKQNLVLKRQAFENTFFNLLNSQRELTERLETQSLETTGLIIKGVYIFGTINSRIYQQADAYTTGTQEERIRKAFGDTTEHYLEFSGSYLVSLNSLLQFIERSDFVESEMQFYFEIVGTKMLFAELKFLKGYIDHFSSDSDVKRRIGNVLRSYV